MAQALGETGSLFEATGVAGHGAGRSATYARRVRACRVRSALPPTRQSGPVRRAGGGPRIRVLLADDHAAVREGLSRLLGQQPDMQVVGEAQDGLTAFDEVRRLRPDVVVMDVTMPGGGGLAATRRLRIEAPASRVIAFSMHEDPSVAAALCDAGAVAYLTKASPPALLVATIRACMDNACREPELAASGATRPSSRGRGGKPG